MHSSHTTDLSTQNSLIKQFSTANILKVGETESDAFILDDEHKILIKV